MCSQVRHVVQHDFVTANPGADFSNALMRQRQQIP
jgi:hypothetical protein